MPDFSVNKMLQIRRLFVLKYYINKKLFMKENWNSKYNNQEYLYGLEPNAFFKEFIGKETRASILLPAEGEGRNAVFAAKNGFDVTAFDYSETGRLKALKFAEEKGVSIKYNLVDINEYSSTDKFDYIGLFYAHFPLVMKNSFFAKLADQLETKGKIVLEVFSTKQIQYSSGGPKDETMLFTKEEISSYFKSLKTILLEEKEINLSEGPGHTGKACVIRYIGQK